MGTGKSRESLTDEAYWTAFYQCHQRECPDRRSIIAAASRLDSCWQEFRNAAGQTTTVCEIGCYPGRYLAYVASKFNLRALGIDLNPDMDTVVGHLKTMGVDNYAVKRGDFLTHEPNEKAGMVFSLGFVEHFENVGEVLDRHLAFLAERGALFVAVPNMRGLIHPYKWLADRANLDVHNLAAMRPSVFREFGERNGLTTHFVKFQGSFPWSLHQAPNVFQRVLYYAAKSGCRLFEPFIRRFPSHLYSGELVALYSR